MNGAISNSSGDKPTRQVSPVVLWALAATWLVGGSMFIAIRLAMQNFPPLFQTGSQFLTGGILLGGFMMTRGARLPGLKQWAAMAILGCLMLCGGYGLIALAEKTVGSGLVVSFIAIVPGLIALMELPYGVRPGLRQWVGIIVGLIGVVGLTMGKGFSGSLGGLTFVSVGCLTWALGSVWSVHGFPGRIKVHVPSEAMGYACQMLVGGSLLLVVSWAAGETPIFPASATATGCWFFGVFADLVTFGGFLVLLRRTTPGLATSYAYVNPVVGLALGVTLGDEVVTAYEWVAVSVVLLGVIILLMELPRHEISRA